MAIVMSRVVGVVLNSSEIQLLPSHLQEPRFQTLFPALWTARAMRVTDFGSPAGGAQPALLGTVSPALGSAQGECLQALRGPR